MLPCNCSMMMETKIEKTKKKVWDGRKTWNEKIILDAINFCNTKSTEKENELFFSCLFYVCYASFYTFCAIFLLIC